MKEPQSHGTTEPAYSYRNLALWKQAQDLAHAILELTAELPASRVSETLARQLIRAAASVPANIAEGHGRFSPAAYRNHLSIAKGSACEVDSWLDLLRRLSLISPNNEAQLHQRCSAIIASLTGRMRDLEKLSAKTVREESALYNIGEEFEETPRTDGSEVQGFRGSDS